MKPSSERCEVYLYEESYTSEKPTSVFSDISLDSYCIFQQVSILSALNS